MTEPNQDRLAEALRHLREDAAGKAAPEALEGALLEAFRRHQTTRLQQHTDKRSKRWLWAPAVGIAASIAVAIAFNISARPGANREQPRTVASTTAPPGSAAQQPLPSPAPATEQLRKKAVRARRTRIRQYARTAPAPAPARPRLEAFVQIPYAPAFTPYDDAQVVRVKMPGASVRQLGFPVTSDRVEADLLVGNDGMARGIRLVSNAGLSSYR